MVLQLTLTNSIFKRLLPSATAYVLLALWQRRVGRISQKEVNYDW